MSAHSIATPPFSPICGGRKGGIASPPAIIAHTGGDGRGGGGQEEGGGGHSLAPPTHFRRYSGGWEGLGDGLGEGGGEDGVLPLQGHLGDVRLPRGRHRAQWILTYIASNRCQTFWIKKFYTRVIKCNLLCLYVLLCFLV